MRFMLLFRTALLLSFIFSTKAAEDHMNAKICYPCTRTENALCMDGSGFLAAGWTEKPFISGLIKYTLDSPWLNFAATPLRTEAKAAYDNDFLYFTIACDFPAHEQLTANITGHDGPVWGYDAIEIFLSPGTPGASVYHIILNSRGAIYDEEGKTEKMDREWQSHAKVFTKTFRGKWHAEIAVPWSAFGLSKAPENEIWGFNIARDHHYTNNFPKNHSSWCPFGKNKFFFFGEKEYFGQIKFLKEQRDSGKEKYSYSDSPILNNGDFEFGLSGWHGDLDKATITEDSLHGAYAVEFESTQSVENAKSIQLANRVFFPKNGDYIIRIPLKYVAVDQPACKFAAVVFKDKTGKIVETVEAPNLGNAGGGSSKGWKTYEMIVNVKDHTLNAELVFSLNKIGRLIIDNIEVDYYHPLKNPILTRSPEKNMKLNGDPTFKWDMDSLFEKKYPISFTLEISENKDFPPAATKSFSGLYQEYTPSGFLPNGKYYWRVRMEQDQKTYFSEVASFIMDVTVQNEKIPPEIIDAAPAGVIPEKAGAITVKWCDPYISSGISAKGISVWIDNKKVEADIDLKNGSLKATLPPDHANPCLCKVTIADNNQNKAAKEWFFYHADRKPTCGLDAQGFILKDGKRFFPIARYGIMDVSGYKELSENGFNCNISPWGIPIFLTYLQQGYENGLMTILPIENKDILTGKVAWDSTAAGMIKARTEKIIRSVEGHPGLLGYFLGDESMDFEVRPPIVERWNKMLKRLDPDNITLWLPTYRPIPEMWSSAANGCDMLVRDDYPAGAGRPLSDFVKNAETIKKATNNKPMLVIAEAFTWADYGRKNCRYPTYEEMRFESFASIVFQARGICFFTSSSARFLKNEKNTPEAVEFLKSFYRVSRELKELLPILTFDDSMELADAVSEDGKPVDFLAKVKKNEIWIFAVNRYEERRKVTFKFRQKVSAKAVEVWKSPEVIPFIQNGFADVFPAYGIRLYKVLKK